MIGHLSRRTGERRWAPRRAAIGLALAALGLAAPAAAGEVRAVTETRDYRVYGTSARGVVSYMRQRPFAGDNGPAFANIRPRYGLKLETRKAGDRCRVASLDLDIRFVLTLPRAMDEARMDGRTRAGWQSFRRFAERHEETHRRFYLTCARRFVGQARRMEEASCHALRREVRRALDKADRDCNRLHDAFDAREIPKLPRLTLFRAARVRPAEKAVARRPGAVVHAAYRLAGETAGAGRTLGARSAAARWSFRQDPRLLR